jgi:type III restriction enzyme
MPQTNSPDEKWQLLYNRHHAWKKKLKQRVIRLLTIIVTRDIRGGVQVAEDLKDFLVEWEKLSPEEAGDKVLPVSSSSKHQANVAKSRLVDKPASKEERAFNSKLLIAQVLGRGLRRPDGWQGEDPMVTVFNHDAWSGRIKHLVNEILEIEFDYTRPEDTSEYAKKGEYRLLEQRFVDLPTQVEAEDVTVEFERAVTGEHTKFRTRIQHKTWSIEEVAEQMFQRLKSIDEESREAEDPQDRTSYAKKFPLEMCEEIVRESLKRAKITTGRITDENRQNFLQALGTRLGRLGFWGRGWPEPLYRHQQL